MHRTLALLVLSAALAQACSCDPLPKDALTSCELNQVVQAPVKTDILFVIDDSGSMDEEVVNLESKFQAFLTVLNGSAVANDFQIGVTTTSVAKFDGTLVGAQGALIGPAPVVMKGTDATLLSDFNAKIAAIRSIIGANAGSGKEQPFRAMELALSTPLISGANNGFLRPGSRLAVVFLSDEDDCSETGTNNADDNYKCHNDGRVDVNADGITQSTEPPDGVDYKFKKIDTIDHYESFLRGPIAGEPRDVVLAAIAGVDSVTRSPTCGFDAMQQNRWCCGSALLSSSLTCPASAPACASRQVSNGGLSGDAYCCGEAASPYCTSTCKTAYDKADRFEVLLSRFAPTKRLVASVCDADYSNTLSQIAGLITSNSVPLQGEPADWRLLNVGLRLPDGSRLPCSLALDGTPEAQTADAVYTPGSGGKPPAVTFPDSGSCYLDRGYSVGVEIDVICAG